MNCNLSKTGIPEPIILQFGSLNRCISTEPPRNLLAEALEAARHFCDEEGPPEPPLPKVSRLRLIHS